MVESYKTVKLSSKRQITVPASFALAKTGEKLLLLEDADCITIRPLPKTSAIQQSEAIGRVATVSRTSKETNITLTLAIDGQGRANIKTPIGFFSHMLDNFTKHSTINLDLSVDGDMHVDQHHTIEDTGMVLGTALKKALGTMKGINRSGFCIYPMDDAVSVVSIDIGGRSSVIFKGSFARRFCGDFDTDLLEEFFNGFSRGLGASLYIKLLEGKNDHHKLESIFKGFAKAVKMAISKDARLKDYLPTTKGLIDSI